MNKRQKIAAIRVLRGAAKTLKEVGWCQDTAVKRDHTGKAVSYCLIAAIQVQKGDTSFARQAVVEHLALKSCVPLGSIFVSLPGWNDMRDRKKRQVLDALRFTANRLEKEI